MAKSQQERYLEAFRFEEISLVKDPPDPNCRIQAQGTSGGESQPIAGQELYKAWLQAIKQEGQALDELIKDHENSQYKIYFIRQGKKGKKRRIEEPVEWLMETQRKLVSFFDEYPLLNNCTARKGMGIRDNAAAHADAKYVLRIDISKCYPSVTRDLVMNGIRLIEQEEWRYVARRLANFCFIHKNNNLVLPTGSPTSPILCNIALTPIDIEVERVAREFGYTYTRYIDDLHLSTTQSNRHWNLIERIEQIITSHGLKVNKRKTRWYTVGPNDKVIITGVRIKEGCSVPRQFVRMVRARLQNLAKDRQNIDSETMGCLAYIKSIDPERHNSLLEYYDRRLNYVPADGKRPCSEQVLPRSAGSCG